MFSLARFLQRHDFQVRVLSSRASCYQTFGYERELAELWCESVSDPFLERYQSRLVSDRSQPGFGGLGELLLPDRGVSLLPALVWKALRHPVDVLVTSAPSHSTLLAGLLLKKLWGESVRWVVDYRDGWNGNPHFRKRNRLCQKLNESMERAVLSNCDVFSYVSQPIVESIPPVRLRALPLLIENGFDGQPAGARPLPAGKLKIGYFGSLDRARGVSLDSLLDALRQDPDLSERLEIHLFGTSVEPEAGLPLFSHGWIPHPQVRDSMGEMHYLLVAFGDPKSSREVVSGKLYEYLAARRPLLCLSPPDMEGRRLLEQLGVGCWADAGEPGEVATLLRALSLQHCQALQAVCDRLDLGPFSREGQFRKLLEVL